MKCICHEQGSARPIKFKLMNRIGEYLKATDVTNQPTSVGNVWSMGQVDFDAADVASEFYADPPMAIYTPCDTYIPVYLDFDGYPWLYGSSSQDDVLVVVPASVRRRDD